MIKQSRIKRQNAMEWENDESISPELAQELDMRQSSAGALVRMSKLVGGWSHNDKSYNFIDTSGTTNNVASIWNALVLLNGLVPGTGGSQRIGREIRMYLLKLMVDNNSVARGRHVLVYDKNSNGAAPSITDIFQTNTFDSYFNFSYRDRFAVIFDYVLPFNGGDAHVEEDIELNLETFYNSGSAGTIADISSGALYYTMAVPATTPSTARYSFRIEYEE